MTILYYYIMVCSLETHLIDCKVFTAMFYFIRQKIIISSIELQNISIPTILNFLAFVIHRCIIFYLILYSHAAFEITAN